MSSGWRVIEGDCREVLPTLPAESVQCCVTSPPYWDLRDYGDERQLGREPTPDLYVSHLIEAFREVHRVLARDGTLWLVLGDSYSAHGAGAAGKEAAYMEGAATRRARRPPAGLKRKDLVGIPWMVAFALRADGWWLRAENIWSKPNAKPESVRDRPSRAHEHVFLLTKRERYFYDEKAIREPAVSAADYASRTAPGPTGRGSQPSAVVSGAPEQDHSGWIGGNGTDRNKRSVWNVATAPWVGPHFAPFPPGLIEPCIRAGCPEGATVLDPFSGVATTGLVALRHQRSFVGIELNPTYAEMARQRIREDAPLMNTYSEAA